MGLPPPQPPASPIAARVLAQMARPLAGDYSSNAGAMEPLQPWTEPPPLPSCPSTYDVTAEGATGDGKTDDSKALAAADQVQSFLYFPVPKKTYRIKHNLTLNKPIIVARVRLLAQGSRRLVLPEFSWVELVLMLLALPSGPNTCGWLHLLLPHASAGRAL